MRNSKKRVRSQQLGRTSPLWQQDENKITYSLQSIFCCMCVCVCMSVFVCARDVDVLSLLIIFPCKIVFPHSLVLTMSWKEPCRKIQCPALAVKAQLPLPPCFVQGVFGAVPALLCALTLRALTSELRVYAAPDPSRRLWLPALPLDAGLFLA